MRDPRDAFDRAERMIEEQYEQGLLSEHDRNVELRELGRDYAEAMEEAAEAAHRDELEAWR